MSEYEKINWNVLMQVFTKLRELFNLTDKFSKVTYMLDEMNGLLYDLFKTFSGEEHLTQMLEDYNESY